LWPEKRQHDTVLGDRVPGLIDRTTVRSQIVIPEGYLPAAEAPIQGVFHRLAPGLVDSNGDVMIGPVPSQIPVNLLANMRPLPESSDPVAIGVHTGTLVRLLLKLNHDLLTLPPNATDDDLRKKYANLERPMLALSKCPDFIVNRGHYFGTAEFNNQNGLTADERAFGQEPALSDDDKRALIAFLKTF
jgi:hypothetical protein